MIHNDTLFIIRLMALYIPIIVVIFTFRNFFKTTITWIMGDRTAVERGFLTLNPLVHIDILPIIITLSLVLFSVYIMDISLPDQFIIIFMLVLAFHWVKPIPINTRRFRWYRLGGFISSLAGSVGNLLLVIGLLLIVKYIPWESLQEHHYKTFYDLFRHLIDTALWFAIIDLIPLPPFDGGKALSYLMPRSWHSQINALEKISPFIMLVLLVLPGVGDFFLRSLHLSMWTIKHFLISLLR